MDVAFKHHNHMHEVKGGSNRVLFFNSITQTATRPFAFSAGNVESHHWLLFKGRTCQIQPLFNSKLNFSSNSLMCCGGHIISLWPLCITACIHKKVGSCVAKRLRLKNNPTSHLPIHHQSIHTTRVIRNFCPIDELVVCGRWYEGGCKASEAC